MPQTTRSTQRPQTTRSTQTPQTTRSTQRPQTTVSTQTPQTTRSTQRPQTTRSTQRPQTTISSILVTARPRTFTTSIRTVTKPTVPSFWTEWSPTNDVEVFTVSTTKPTASTNSSQMVMAPWLQDILNEAIASNNISSTTSRTFERLVQSNSGDGFNNINHNIIGER